MGRSVPKTRIESDKRRVGIKLALDHCNWHVRYAGTGHIEVMLIADLKNVATGYDVPRKFAAKVCCLKRWAQEFVTALTDRIGVQTPGRTRRRARRRQHPPFSVFGDDPRRLARPGRALSSSISATPPDTFPTSWQPLRPAASAQALSCSRVGPQASRARTGCRKRAG